jgi:hypothetical protein
MEFVMKTLVLAALAALTLSIGAANAAQPSQQNNSNFWQPHTPLNNFPTVGG